uniref:Uncharacterized protein n=1 Tax=Ganoderma boninense TaxID=34458 RepID=A0A5K1JVM4_9APHY|nr:Uncharacterized protein [Ganoderma boninense]
MQIGRVASSRIPIFPGWTSGLAVQWRAAVSPSAFKGVSAPFDSIVIDTPVYQHALSPFALHVLFAAMDNFDALSLPLVTLEDTQTLSSSLTSSAACGEAGTSSRAPYLLDPPVNQEVINGNGTYSWCTIA